VRIAAACLGLLFAVATPARSQGIERSGAPTFATLVSFNGSDGAEPVSVSLVQGTDGNLYGTTLAGGAYKEGTVFRVTPTGKVTTLYSFCSKSGCADGASPYAGLVQAANGNFYGTTSGGGANGDGTVFEITPGGALTTLYSFCSQTGCTDGEFPYAGLVQGEDGNFYGTTFGTFTATRYGTVFKITPGGKLTTLYSFCSKSGCADGAGPYAGLAQATDGNLYGTTAYGGANDSCGGWESDVGCGTVFRITPSGVLTTLYSFCSQSDCTDGELPFGGLVQGADGNFYGTTLTGTPAVPNYGTIFTITPTGKLTTLCTFCSESGCADGGAPYGDLIQATDGNLYGTTMFGGGNDFCEDPDSEAGCGTVFKITPGGALTTLYSFCAQGGCADSQWPLAGLVQDTDGNLFGLTAGASLTPVEGGICQAGGNTGGTIFRLALGLGPFVETRPTSGAVGEAVIILGSNLMGATGVSFNGTATRFTVVSNTEIKTNVPEGASTGKVQVTTPRGTLTSNVTFHVVGPCATGPCMQPVKE